MTTKNPVPLRIKAVVLLSAAAAVYSFTVLPSALNAGFAYERGNKAQEENRHITAIREYEFDPKSQSGSWETERHVF